MKQLTDMQDETLRRIAAGHTHYETAAALQVQRTTIDSRLEMIRKKLNAKTTAHAIMIYYTRYKDEYL